MSESNISYNNAYYEKNKERIKEQMFRKEICQFCSREVNHQNIARHKKSKLCMNNRTVHNAPDLMTMIANLEAKILAIKG